MSRRSTLVAGNPWLASLATLVTWTILGAPGAFAQFHQVRIVIDADNDPATGCSVDLIDPASPSGFTTFHGSEFTAIVEIDPLPDPPDALNPRLISCPPFSGTPETTPLPDANEVEADLGYKGSDAVALQIPMEALGYPGTMRLAVESKSAAASTDLLLAPGGQVILFDASTVAVPGMGALGFLALALLFLVVGVRFGSRRAGGLAGLGIVACLLAAAWYAGPARAVTTWIAIFENTPELVLDAQGDSENGDSAADLRALYARRVSGDVWLRVDLDDVEFHGCSGGDLPGDVDCDGVCDAIDAVTSIDCDGACDAGEGLAGGDCNGICESGDAVGSFDCDDICDELDPVAGSDCDGLCSDAEAMASPDCNQICEVGDGPLGPDCDAFCDVLDGLGSPDCVVDSGCPDVCGCHTLPDGSCECIRVRKEIRSMTVAERTRYINTFKAVYDDPGGQLKQHVEQHLRFFSRGLHNNGAFLPWHRGCLLDLENMLQEFDCRVTVPYWNWSLSAPVIAEPFFGVAADQFSANGDAQRCVRDGPFGENAVANPPFSPFLLTTGRCLQRRISGGSAANLTTVGRLPSVQYPQPNQYDSFRNRLEHGPGLHDSVHCIVGGTMCSARAANDPIFYSHHSNIDRIWFDWQELSPAHEAYYTGNTALNSLMPTSAYTPAEMLDIDHLPAPGGPGPRAACSVKVVYAQAPCGPNLPCGVGEVCFAAPARSSSLVCQDDCPECTGVCIPDPAPLADNGCTSDTECTAGSQWCRAAASGTKECADVQLEGEACNCDEESTCTAPDSAALRCGDALQCSGATSEAPGVCIKPCDSSCTSSNGLYCTPGGSCKPIGSCRADLDCEAAGNTFEDRLDPSKGYGLCVYSECKSECGDRRCVDLAGVDLGQCGTPLGWGRLWGECQEIFGCSSSLENFAFGLFSGKEECNATCLDQTACLAACDQACTSSPCLEACQADCDCKLR